MSWESMLIVGVIVVLVSCVLYIGYGILTDKSEQERRDALGALAAEKGWTYTEEDPTLVALSTGEPFGEGKGQRAVDVFRGELNGHGFTSFDYTYEVTRGSGSSRQTVTYNNMVTCIDTPRSRHWLRVGPERTFSGLLGALGIQDIQLESDVFNQRFGINADTDRFAYDVLNPRTMRRMLDEPRYFNEVRFEEGKLIAWFMDRLEGERVEPTVRYLIDILTLVPDFAWEQH